MKHRNSPSELATSDVDPTIDTDVARLLESLEDDAPPAGAEAALLARIEAASDAKPPPRGSSWTSPKALALAAGLLVAGGLGVMAATRDDSTASGGIPVQSPPVVSPPATASTPLVAPPERGDPVPAEHPATTSTAAPTLGATAADSASPRASLHGASPLPSSRSPRTTAAPSSSAVVVDNGDSFRDQLAMIESARHSLSQGSPAECLATLRRYEEKYPSRVFGVEARVVRTEALMAAGESEKAFALARELIAADPRGPYADRLRALLPKTDGLDR